MTGALIILLFLILVGVVLRFLDKRRSPARDTDATAEPERSADELDGAECCGQHLVCEKLSLAPLSGKIEYFDDEELDRFRQREPDSFTEQEIEEFREILLSMRPEEVPAWTRSLQLREVTIPPPIREEILLIAFDLRFK